MKENRPDIKIPNVLLHLRSYIKNKVNQDKSLSNCLYKK